MKISDLPPKLKELAEKRKAEYEAGLPTLNLIGVGLAGAFNWSRTPEGFYFWDKVNKDPSKIEYPK